MKRCHEREGKRGLREFFRKQSESAQVGPGESEHVAAQRKQYNNRNGIVFMYLSRDE